MTADYELELKLYGDEEQLKGMLGVVELYSKRLLLCGLFFLVFFYYFIFYTYIIFMNKRKHILLFNTILERL